MAATGDSPVFLIETPRFGDERGWFMETFAAKRATEAGITATFVQDNQSYSRSPATLRGLHFQTPPHAQAKLVRCLRGEILDVAVDVRAGSPTYGMWVGCLLTAMNGRQLYIPEGFAHAFLTLVPDCEIAYKVSDYYAPDCDGGLRWNDPDVAVDWTLPAGTQPLISAKDAALPFLDAFQSPFSYDGWPLRSLGPDHFGSAP